MRFSRLVSGALVLVVMWLGIACGGDEAGGDNTSSTEAQATSLLPTPTPSLPAPTPEVTAASPSATGGAATPADNRLRIQSIGVDAPIVRSPVGRDAQLVDPPSKDAVALQDFSQWESPTYGGLPGSGNTIIFGAFDKTSGCPNGQPACGAVFFDLRKLRRGMEIQVTWEQKVYTYTVSALCSIPLAGTDNVVKTTPTERITLMTFGGDFVNGGYTHLVFVTAEPTLVGDTPQCPDGASRGLPAG